MEDEELRRLHHLLLPPGLLMQKYYKDLDALFRIGNEIFRALAETEGNQNLKYNYFDYLSVLFTKDESKFRKMINQLPADVKENTKHFIQKVEERGVEKTKQKAVQNMLHMNADIDFICEALDVPKQYVLDIRGNMKK